ncbi:MAG TPA: hypothetical protein VK034_08585 [Enhygromyxa sp.]|nr:hypothetical protein [Enhygromyxa sp.]
MRARLQSAAFVCGLACLLGCPERATDSPNRSARSRERDDVRRPEGDPRVDPARCTGDDLEIDALVESGLCTIPADDALALPGPELLEIQAPAQLLVAPGQRLEFDLVLRNRGGEPLDVDLRFRRFLPLEPDSTETLAGSSAPDPSCTLRAMSTEPLPERISLPPEAELAIPCEWYANTRLADPDSYVGSDCRDFPPLAEGRYRSVYRISGGAGSPREIAVEIQVRAQP